MSDTITMPDNPYEAPQSESHGGRYAGKCPVCGDVNFREGTVSYANRDVVFVPDNWPFLRLRSGLDLKALACTGCGHVRFFVAQKDLGSLQNE